MTRKILLLALVGAVLVGFSPALADGDFYVVVVPGGVGTKITSLPYTITAPGFYYLTGNLTCPSGNGITVNSDDVTIDLMGFRLSGNTSSTGIYMNGRKNVEIRNGTLRGWNNAIHEFSSSGVNHRVINVRAEENFSGIILNAVGSLVKGCTAANNKSGSGIEIFAGTVSGNQVRNCYYGIFVSLDGNVTGNMVSDCHYGIYIPGSCSVIANIISCVSGETGIYLSTSASDPILVDQNTVTGGCTHYAGGGPATEWGVNAGK